MVKEIVLKTRILSLFTHPQVVSNLYEFLYSTEHKKYIFWRMSVRKQLMDTI